MKRLKRMTSVFALLLMVSILTQAVNIGAVAGASHYTYTYDCWGEDRESPDAYAVTRTFSGGTIAGCGDFNAPEGMYVVGNDTYVVDTGNNRIVQLVYKDDAFHFVRQISTFTSNGVKDALKGPQDCYVTKDGQLYIADTGNLRIVHLDKNLKLIKIITRPTDSTVSQTAKFLPRKLVVDGANRIFVQVTGVNKGFMEFANDGSFSGYMGASEVTFDFFSFLWKLVATKAQKEQLDQFVPTEYSNLCLDSDDFLYATISTFETAVEVTKPIRKLNAKGKDILIRNGYADPYGDYYYTSSGEYSGPSKMIDVCTLANDTYYTLDSTKKRVFGYDFQGNMLFAFGGPGFREGYFVDPKAIEDIGPAGNESLLILDGKLGSITQMSLTNYGKLINEGLAQYKLGAYDKSAAAWKKVLKLNGNYDLAYIGIGRAQLRQEDYKGAMKNFELKIDDVNYSKAYKLYRKEWIEDNIAYIVGILIFLVLLGYGYGFIKRAKKEVKEG